MRTSSPDKRGGVQDSHMKNTGSSFPKDSSSSAVQLELKQRGIKTLCDFVDEESIREVTGRAEMSFQ